MRPFLALLAAGVAVGSVAPALAQSSAADPADAPADASSGSADGSGGEVVVLGFGQSRQVQSVTAADIARLTPGSSPLKAIEKLPGVNFQAADPFGAYEWAVRISLRGFNQNQLGFTLDDVPLGDMSYGNVNGLHISRAIISENVARTEVAQGAGALGTASTSNLGGTIQFFSAKPKDAFGLEVAGTYGSDNTYRPYVRIDSGEFGDGWKGYLSYAFLHTDKWKGDGPQRQHQANAKLVKDLGPLGSVTGFFNFSDRRETDYQDLSLDIIRRRGYRDDNLTSKSLYPLAIELAQDSQANRPLPAPYGTIDDSYFDAGGLRRDYLAGLTFDAHLAPGLSLKTTGYYHSNKGQGSWITPYSPTPLGAPNADGTPITDPAPLGFRTTEYAIHRGGVISTAQFTTGPNTIEVGGWIESNSFRQARRFYGMTDTATPNRDTLQFQRNPYLTQWDGLYDTLTLQYHVEDTLKLLDDRLVLNAGWKGVRVDNDAQMIVTGGLAQGDIKAKDWFQPQAGLVFHLSPMAELFADYTENMRAFVSSATTGPFSTTQAGFDAIRGQLKPERSRTGEGGLRFRQGGFQGSLVGYYVDFTNRLLAFQIGPGIVGNPSVLQNVGAVHTYGAEATASYRILPPLSVFASYSFNHSEYADNVVGANGAVLVATDGKTVVDTPKHMVKGEVVYDDGRFMARVGADYMTKRYFTYLDDESVPSRLLVDAGVGYTFHGDGALDGLSIQGNVTNLTNKHYVATVGSNGFTASGDNQTLLAGAPRQWFVTVRKAF